MLESLIAIIPIEKHGMSIFTVLAFLFSISCCYFVFTILITRIKYLKEKGKVSFMEVDEKHTLLKTDFEKTKDKLHEKIDTSFCKMSDKMDGLMANIAKLSTYTAEQRMNNNNIAKNIDDIKKDFRDFKNKKD